MAPCWVMSTGREGVLEGGYRVQTTEQVSLGQRHGLGFASVTLLSPHNPLSYAKLPTFYRCGNGSSERLGHLLKVTQQVRGRFDFRAQGLCIAQLQGTLVVGETPALYCLNLQDCRKMREEMREELTPVKRG